MYALYGQSTRLLIAMMFLLVMDVVGSIAQAESAVKGVTFDGGCNLMKRPFQLYVAWYVHSCHSQAADVAVDETSVCFQGFKFDL